MAGVPLLFRLQSPFYQMVKSGQKTVEGRLYRPKYSLLKAGGEIRLCSDLHSHEYVDASIRHLRVYHSFYEMLRQEGLHRCLPGVRTLDEGVRIYYGFEGYRENEKLLGVLAIAFSLNSQKKES